MPYYIHGRDLQAVNASTLSLSELDVAVRNAFLAKQFPAYLQNPGFIYSALLAQLNGSSPDLQGTAIRVDINRGTFIHGERDKETNFVLQYPNVPPEVKASLKQNYPQSFSSLIEISLNAHFPPGTVKPNRLVSIDEMQETRPVTSSDEKGVPDEPQLVSPAQLYAWHVHSNIKLEQKDPDAEPFPFSSLPGHVSAQFRVTAKGNVVDYFFCSNRLLYDLNTQGLGYELCLLTDDTVPQPNKFYVRKKGNNIEYKLISPSNTVVTKTVFCRHILPEILLTNFLFIREPGVVDDFDPLFRDIVRYAAQQGHAKPPLAITKERIEEAEAEEKFNLTLYFPLKVVLRQLGTSQRAEELRRILNDIDSRQPQYTSEFQFLTDRYKPRFTALMREIVPELKKEKTTGPFPYEKMQADDRCMMLAVTRNKLVTQFDKPMAAIMGQFEALSPADKEHLPETMKKLEEMRTTNSPYYEYNKILLRMSNPDYYDHWVTQYIDDLKAIAESPELARSEFADIRMTMEVMIEFARLQDIAHQMAYSERGQQLQDCIVRFHKCWEWTQSSLVKAELHELIKTLIQTQKYITPSLDSVSEVAIGFLSERLKPIEADMKYSDPSPEAEVEEKVAETVPTPEKKPWNWWLIGTAGLVCAAIALPFVGQAISLALAAEELLYVGMGLAGIGGAFAQWSTPSSESNKKWMLGIGLFCVALAIAIPIVGQAIAASFVAMTLLSIAFSTMATYFLASLRSKKSMDQPAEVHATPVEVVAVSSEFAHRQRPETLYELPDVPAPVAEEKRGVAEEEKRATVQIERCEETGRPREIETQRPTSPSSSVLEISSPSSTDSHVSRSTHSEPSTPPSLTDLPPAGMVTHNSSGSSTEESPPASTLPSPKGGSTSLEIILSSDTVPKYAQNPFIHFNALTKTIAEKIAAQNQSDATPTSGLF